MNITRETDYAVRCMLYLSKNPSSVAAVDSIASEMEVPKSFLAKILQRLAKAGLVKSMRGVKGGFQLAEKPSSISLLSVIEAIQGPMAINVCVLDKKSCSRSSFCSVHPVWIEIQDTIKKKFSEYTFSRFAKEEAERGRRK